MRRQIPLGADHKDDGFHVTNLAGTGTGGVHADSGCYKIGTRVHVGPCGHCRKICKTRMEGYIWAQM